MNQKTIEHIEWKIDNWLLNFKLLTEDKLKILYATHTTRTTSPDKPTYNIKEMPTLNPLPKQNETNNQASNTVDGVQNIERQIISEDKKVTNNKGMESNKPETTSTQKMIPDNSSITKSPERLEESQEISSNIVPNNLSKVLEWLSLSEEEMSNIFNIDIINNYYRYKKMIQKEASERSALPVCLFIYDSRRHTPERLQEFMEISKQITNIAYYAIFDYSLIKPQTWEEENIEPIEQPTIWIWDQKTGFEKKFNFSSSELANTLADMKESFKNKGSIAPIPSNSVPETEPHQFESKEEGDDENLAELEDLDQEQLEVESYPEIPENIEQTAQIYEQLDQTERPTIEGKKAHKKTSRTEKTIQSLKEKMLKLLSEQPMSIIEIRDLMEGKYQYKLLARKELEMENKIIKNGNKWAINLEVIPSLEDKPINESKSFDG